MLWQFEERAKCAQAGDWGGVGAVAVAIVALTKGNGKGKRVSGRGPRGGAGAGHKVDGRAVGATYSNSKGSGKKGEVFDGYCHHCNGYGHRKSQSRLLDQEIAAEGKGEGKSRGKGLCYPGADKQGDEDPAS